MAVGVEFGVAVGVGATVAVGVGVGAMHSHDIASPVFASCVIFQIFGGKQSTSSTSLHTQTQCRIGFKLSV